MCGGVREREREREGWLRGRGWLSRPAALWAVGAWEPHRPTSVCTRTLLRLPFPDLPFSHLTFPLSGRPGVKPVREASRNNTSVRQRAVVGRVQVTLTLPKTHFNPEKDVSGQQVFDPCMSSALTQSSC